MDFVGKRVGKREDTASQRRVKRMRGGMVKYTDHQNRERGEFHDMSDFSQKIIPFKTALETRDR
jgi:hypothetical protein